MRVSTMAAAAIALVFATPGAAEHHAGPALTDVLAYDLRGEDSVRDQYRNPAQTLAFFGVEPGMTVVDFMPSSGWYSRVLIPYLGEEGTYIGLDPEVAPDETGGMARYRDTAARLPSQARDWLRGSTAGGRVLGFNLGEDTAAVNGTVDRVLIFREMHNIRRFGWLHGTLVTARKLLKDDGMVGVVQHRADADAPAEYVLGDFGYLREQDVIGLFEAYGFELVARSEINANPADPADWDAGVWSLPPRFAGAEDGSAEHARRSAIGESDRMTLLFRKRP